jgi:hypothetical protein
MNWPVQTDCDAYYGNPRGRDGRASGVWERANLTRIAPPFAMTFSGKPIKTITIHRKCADSLSRVLAAIRDAAAREPRLLDEWGANVFGGAYVYRVMRGGSRLSMHAYGCAIDLDPARNAFHDETPHFALPPAAVVKAFESEGWEWGGRWKDRACDGMHFQAARTR